MSVYSNTNKLFNPKNKGRLGTLKDEYPNNYITKFVCLRSKCYCLNSNFGENCCLKNKGIQKNSMQAINLDIQDFENFLIKDKDLEEIMVEQINIRSFNHNVYTVKCNKVCLSLEDDSKRVSYIDENENNKFKKNKTRAFGHYLNYTNLKKWN